MEGESTTEQGKVGTERSSIREKTPHCWLWGQRRATSRGSRDRPAGRAEGRGTGSPWSVQGLVALLAPRLCSAMLTSGSGLQSYDGISLYCCQPPSLW